MMPILVMDAIILVVTVLLAVADRVLVTYGSCTITVTKDEETREFTVDGGGYLHSALTENGTSISSSCGGKATCGYCKVRVLSGGGRVLPTEEIFMSRQELRDGMRLACQVKVKNDLEVFVPDFLTTVRGMVKNGTFDTKVKWRVKIDDRTPELLEKKSLALTVSDEEGTTLDAIIEEQRDPAGSVVPVLQGINSRYNYLPENLLRVTSERTDVPLSAIFRLASFYNAFSLTPTGKYVITVCSGTACHVKGAGRLISMLEEDLGIAKGSTTEDMLFTLKTVRCIGCCGLAPVVLVGDEIHGQMHRRQTLKVVEDLRSVETVA